MNMHLIDCRLLTRPFTRPGRTLPPNGLPKKEEQKAAVCYFGGICRSHAAPSIPAPGFPNLP